MPTAFKQLKNNALTTVLDDALNNDDLSLTFGVRANTGGDFPTPGNGFYVTAWQRETYPDAHDDPDMRIGLCTVRSGDNLTVTWGYFNTPVTPIEGTPTIGLFILEQHFQDLYDAVNAVEGATFGYVYNVKTYGAVGADNNGNNDTAAIQEAIDDANAAGGGIVFFPAGSYRVDGLTMYSNVTLLGAGMSASAIRRRTPSTGVPLITMAGTTPVLGSGAVSASPLLRASICDIQLSSNGLSGAIVRAYYASSILFSRVRFISGDISSALEAVEFWNSRFMNCVFDGCGDATHPTVLLQNRATAVDGDAGYSSSNCTDIRFYGCWWRNSAGTMLELDGVSNSASRTMENIYVTSCKLTTDQFADPLIDISAQTFQIVIDACYLSVDGNPVGYVGGAKDIIRVGGSTSKIVNCLLEQTVVNIVNAGIHYTSTHSSNRHLQSGNTFNWNSLAIIAAAVLVDNPATSSRVTMSTLSATNGTLITDNSGTARFTDNLRIDAATGKLISTITANSTSGDDEGLALIFSRAQPGSSGDIYAATLDSIMTDGSNGTGSGAVVGAKITGTLSGLGDVDDIGGAWLNAETSGAGTGAVARMYGARASITRDSSGIKTITDARVVYVQGITGTGLDVITTAYGIYINSIIEGATENYAIFTNGGRVRFGGALSVVPIALTDAATIATDAALGNHFKVTLGGNRTLGNPTNPFSGQYATWELIQDGTGGRTITLGSDFALGTDISSVTLTLTASKRDFLTAVYNGVTSKWYVIDFKKGY